MNHLYCAGRRAFYAAPCAPCADVSGNRHRPAVTTVHVDGTNALLAREAQSDTFSCTDADRQEIKCG